MNFGEALREIAIEAIKMKDDAIGIETEDFSTGYLSDFHRVITLLQQQAEIFDIPLSELSLNDIRDIDLM